MFMKFRGDLSELIFWSITTVSLRLVYFLLSGFIKLSISLT